MGASCGPPQGAKEAVELYWPRSAAQAVAGAKGKDSSPPPGPEGGQRARAVLEPWGPPEPPLLSAHPALWEEGGLPRALEGGKKHPPIRSFGEWGAQPLIGLSINTRTSCFLKCYRS